MTKTIDLKRRGRGASKSIASTLPALSPLTERVVMVRSVVAPEVERRLREMAQADGRTLSAMIALILTRAASAQPKRDLKGVLQDQYLLGVPSTTTGRVRGRKKRHRVI